MPLQKQYKIKFYTTKTKEEIESENSEFKMDNNYFNNLVDRVTKELPNITRSEVKEILTLFFHRIKINLLLGKVIRVTKLFIGLRLHATNFHAPTTSIKVLLKGNIPKKNRR